MVFPKDVSGESGNRIFCPTQWLAQTFRQHVTLWQYTAEGQESPHRTPKKLVRARGWSEGWIHLQERTPRRRNPHPTRGKKELQNSPVSRWEWIGKGWPTQPGLYLLLSGLEVQKNQNSHNTPLTAQQFARGSQTCRCLGQRQDLFAKLPPKAYQARQQEGENCRPNAQKVRRGSWVQTTNNPPKLKNK